MKQYGEYCDPDTVIVYGALDVWLDTPWFGNIVVHISGLLVTGGPEE